MKKWTRTVSVVMSAVILFSMTACGKAAQDPKAALDAAVEKNAALTSIDMESMIKMTMSQGEESSDFSTDMNVKMTDINQENMQYLSDATLSVLGQSIDMTIFYADGYYYMDSLGQKIKYPMDMVQIMETVKKSTETQNLTSDQMTEVSMTKMEDYTVISFTADPAKMNTYVGNALGSLTGAGLEGMEVTIKEVSGTYTVNQEGYYTDMTMKINMDMTVQGETLTVALDMAAKVNNPGRPVTLELPSTEGFTEIDPPAEAA